MNRSNLWHMKSNTNQGWSETDNIYGHKPKFEMKCAFCKSTMRLRHSTILPDNSANCMAYKCPSEKGEMCGWFIRFFITSNEKYLMKIRDKYRKGENFFVPVEDFRNDDAIKERLESLGYW